VLDGLAASLNAKLRGTSPVRVWQYVASSLVGPDSYSRGMTTVLLGLFIHFCVAFGAATVFYLASSHFPVLIRRAVLFGIIYGIAVYFIMGRIFVPLTRARTFPFSVQSLVTGLLIHILFIGLPIALLARRSARAA
jgi:uncharacterized membrane protein